MKKCGSIQCPKTCWKLIKFASTCSVAIFTKHGSCSESWLLLDPRVLVLLNSVEDSWIFSHCSEAYHTVPYTECRRCIFSLRNLHSKSWSRLRSIAVSGFLYVQTHRPDKRLRGQILPSPGNFSSSHNHWDLKSQTLLNCKRGLIMYQCDQNTKNHKCQNCLSDY